MTTVVRKEVMCMRLSDATLHDRTVISADGKAIGSITELFISSTDWRVESIRIELRKDIADRIGANRTIFHRGTLELPVSFMRAPYLGRQARAVDALEEAALRWF